MNTANDMVSVVLQVTMSGCVLLTNTSRKRWYSQTSMLARHTKWESSPRMVVDMKRQPRGLSSRRQALVSHLNIHFAVVTTHCCLNSWKFATTAAFMDQNLPLLNLKVD